MKGIGKMGKKKKKSGRKGRTVTIPVPKFKDALLAFFVIMSAFLATDYIRSNVSNSNLLVERILQVLEGQQQANQRQVPVVQQAPAQPTEP